MTAARFSTLLFAQPSHTLPTPLLRCAAYFHGCMNCGLLFFLEIQGSHFLSSIKKTFIELSSDETELHYKIFVCYVIRK